MKTKFISLIVSVAVIFGLMLVPAVPVAAVGGVGIEVQPSLTKVGYNEAFDVNVTIIDTIDQDIAAWTIYLEFNTTLMQVTGLTECTMLPTGNAPDDAPGYPKYNNTSGVVDHQSGVAALDPYVNSSFVALTIHCLSNNVTGTGALDFMAISPIARTWVEDGTASPVLDWDEVVNGTVKVGKATLSLSIGMDLIVARTTANYSCLLPGLYANNVTEYRMPTGAGTARIDFCPWANRLSLGGAVPVQVKAMDVNTDAFGDFTSRTIYLNAWTGGPSWLDTSIVQNFAYDAMPHGALYSLGKNWTYNSTMWLPDLATWNNGSYMAVVTTWEMVPLNAGCGVPAALPCYKVVRSNTNGTPLNPGDDWVSGIDWYADPVYAGALGNMVVKQVEYELFAPNPDTSVLSGVGMPAGAISILTAPHAGTPSLPDATLWDWDTVVGLLATAAPGYTFSHWNGDLVCSTANPDSITMSDDKTVIAMFCELPPAIDVDPADLTGANKFTARYNMENPANQTLTITNTGGGTLAWTASDDAGWLTMDVTDGNLTNGQSNVSTVSVDALSGPLAVGTYWANITITGSTVVVPVELEIQEATTIVVTRDLPADALDYDAEFPGDSFFVYVNFTSPVDDFNAIGLNDFAPEGWDVETNVSWCTPAADYTKSPYNKAEYAWEGPFAKDVNFTAVYKVTIPATAVPGLSTWGGNCTGATTPCPPCEGSPITLYEVWVDYWFAAQGPYESPIMGECQKIVTVPGCVVGETRDVNGDLLDTVLVTLLEDDDVWEDDDSSSIVAGPVTKYQNCADDTGYYYQIATKYCFKTVNSRPQGDGGTIPGVRNPNYPDYIDWTTPELLAAGAVVDFVGDYGLVCKAASMSYAMESINHHLFTPLDGVGTPQPDWKLSNWKAMESIASWQFPAGCGCC